MGGVWGVDRIALGVSRYGAINPFLSKCSPIARWTSVGTFGPRMGGLLIEVSLLIVLGGGH